MSTSGPGKLEQALSERLIYSPFLRLVLFNFWFRLAFASLVFLLASLVLLLPKIWRVTPAGVTPEFRISGLDMVQAWSLRRSAQRSAAAGHFDEAAFSWEAAVGNHPGNPELLRGALRNTLRIERPGPRLTAVSLWQAGWLLKIEGTNRLDVSLVAELCSHLHMPESVLQLLAPYGENLTDAESGFLLRALFHAEQFKQFDARWEKLADRQASPELALYRAAYLAGWGTREQAGEGKRRLEAALENPELRILASRLQLPVAANRGDAEGYRDALERLDRWQAGRLGDHAVYWQMLAASGRKAEAGALAAANPRPPTTAAEAVRLGETYVELGMTNEALRFLEAQTEAFGGAAQIWIVHANLLIQQRRWEELRIIALKIRMNDAVRSALEGYSHYLEGRAEVGLERLDSATSAFLKAGRRPFENRALALATAEGLIQLGFWAVAREILAPLEGELAASGQYWQQMFVCAFEGLDSSMVLKAAEKIRQLQPGSLAAMNNYSAALLVNRTKPEEAVRLTLELANRFPRSAAARFNHAVALLHIRRTDEAEALLYGIDPARFSSREHASWQLAQTEICLNREQYDKARQMSERIDVNQLFPPQIRWLRAVQGQLASVATGE